MGKAGLTAQKDALDAVRLATRGSALALAQAEIVRKKLAAYGYNTQIVTVTTRGDRDLRPLRTIGGDGLFVRETERAVLSGKAQMAVHCAKDLPYRLADGLVIGGVLPAADPRDVLVTREGCDTNRSFVVGTGSPRRAQQLRALFPSAVCRDIRGSVPTRIDKLRQGEYDGLILARAGLDRLGLALDGLSVRPFSVEEMLPAPGQGLLVLETLADDPALVALAKRVSDESAARRFVIERELFVRLKADCTAAIGVYAQLTGERVRLSALFGSRQAVVEGDAADYLALCGEAEQKLLEERG